MTDPLQQPGIGLDIDHLLRLRHISIPQRTTYRQLTNLPGGLAHRKHGRGLEPIDSRPYETGDDFRHIDHNATARTGITHVRRFQDERERVVILLADFRACMHWGTRRALRSVAGAETLAILGWRNIALGGRVGLIAFGMDEPVFVAARNRTMPPVLAAMARAHRQALRMPVAREEPMLEELVTMAGNLAPKGALVYLATGLDNPGDNFLARASFLMQRTQLRVLLILDAFETDPPSGQYAYQTPQGTRGRARLDRQSVRAIPDARLAYLSEAKIPYDLIPSIDPPEKTTAILEYGLGRA